MIKRYILSAALCLGAGNYSAAGEADKPDDRRAGLEEAVMKNTEFAEEKADTGKNDGFRVVDDCAFMTCAEYVNTGKGNEIKEENFKESGKRKFSSKEKITFLVCVKNRKGGKLEFALMDSNGNRIGSGKGKTDIESDIFLTGNVVEAKDYKPGKYFWGYYYSEDKIPRKKFLGWGYSVEITE